MYFFLVACHRKIKYIICALFFFARSNPLIVICKSSIKWVDNWSITVVMREPNYCGLFGNVRNPIFFPRKFEIIILKFLPPEVSHTAWKSHVSANHVWKELLLQYCFLWPLKNSDAVWLKWKSHWLIKFVPLS